MQPRISIIRLVGTVVLLWLCAWATVIKSQSGEDSSDRDSMIETQSCSRTSDPDLSQKLRLEAIKHELLLRLGLDEAPPNPDPNSIPPADDPTFAEKNRTAHMVAQAHNANQKPCTKLNTHKKKLLAFFPSDIKGYPPTRHPTQDLAVNKYSKTATG